MLLQPQMCQECNVVVVFKDHSILPHVTKQILLSCPMFARTVSMHQIIKQIIKKATKEIQSSAPVLLQPAVYGKEVTGLL